jgi:hypothetical protein
LTVPRILRQEAQPSQNRHRTRTTGVGRVVEDGRSIEAGVAAAADNDVVVVDENDSFVDDFEVAVIVGAVRVIVEVV